MMIRGNKAKALRYLGGISGQGIVTQNGKRLAQANFDLDGYFRAAVGVTGSGEIQAPAEILKGLFGRTDLQLLTDRGLLLDLSFSDATLAPASEVAHVDVTGQLPTTPSD
ncbi:hypothetical protein QM467_17855 [Rhodoblastus sp. 17X3]|uniref:hypothetical protein n=1 Tax=Rhodoblastus sp. 17X3 TaxID=3047026 RepID=UPI0024B6CEFC|nr:hypothetical protein [Rhodoblastus sp. 17X3]MDI9849910.1 hypothetical protein [Rhodoblastus sp. 17X3]